MAGVAIILGSAGNALSDLEAALAIAPGAPVICVNDALRTCPVKPFAFATLHPEKHKRFLDGLDIDGLPIYSGEDNADEKRPWIIVREKWRGTSGLYGVQVALFELGFDRAIVAGIPISADAGTAYTLEARYRGVWAGGLQDRYRESWRIAHKRIHDRVRSMSGWTRKLFGAPSAEWVCGLSATA